MTRYDGRHWLLAVGVSAVAGYVDAIGFLKLGGLFVSFMSGNSTRMAVGFIIEPHVALTAARLLVGFVAGVIAGTLLAMAAGSYRKPVLLGFVGIALAGGMQFVLHALLGFARDSNVYQIVMMLTFLVIILVGLRALFQPLILPMAVLPATRPTARPASPPIGKRSPWSKARAC